MTGSESDGDSLQYSGYQLHYQMIGSQIDGNSLKYSGYQLHS